MHSVIAELVRVIMKPATQKKLFGKPYITTARFLGCYEQAFESGAVLGYAFRGRLSTFAQLFSDPGREHELASWMEATARQHFTDLGKPENFFDLAMWYEKSRAEDVWRKAGVAQADIDQLIDGFKVPLGDAFERLQVSMTMGIGFGSACPEQTEIMWREAYEKPHDPDKVKLMLKAGLSLGRDELKSLPLVEQQEKLLSFVRLFVTTARPDLLSQFS
jgi:hypothetical protein